MSRTTKKKTVCKEELTFLVALVPVVPRTTMLLLGRIVDTVAAVGAAPTIALRGQRVLCM